MDNFIGLNISGCGKSLVVNGEDVLKFKAERDALQLEVFKLQAELTKARECIGRWVGMLDTPATRQEMLEGMRAFLSNQSAPANKGQGEQIVFGCSRCGGTQAEWSAKCIHCHPAEQPAPVAVVPDFKMIGTEPMPPMEYDEP